MEETANNAQETATQETEAKEQKTFTQEELNQIVSERVKKERSKYEGFEEMKTKAAKYEKLQEDSKSDLQKAEDKAAKLEEELNSMKKADEIRKIKSDVAQKTGIPEELLIGETEEACEEQAKAIKDFVDKKIEEARANGYPHLRDSGETHGAKSSTSQQFADWFKNQL